MNRCIDQTLAQKHENAIISFKNILLFIQVLLWTFLALQLFMRLENPLLWNDEAETAMYGERILKFGYPKVNDGKNMLYLLCPWLEFGTINNTGYVGSGWIQYYTCSIGVWIAGFFKDFSLKTFFIRLPFTLIGFFSLIGFNNLLRKMYKENYKHFISIIFLVFLNFHTQIILYFREARYYSLISLGLYLLLNNLLSNKCDSRKYFQYLLINLFNFNCFYPFAVISFLYSFPFLFFEGFRKKTKNYITTLISIFSTGFGFICFYYFYHISKSQAALKKIFFGTSWINKISFIVKSVFKLDYIIIIILFALIHAILRYLFFKKNKPKKPILHAYIYLGFILFFILLSSFAHVIFIRYFLVLHILAILIVSIFLMETIVYIRNINILRVKILSLFLLVCVIMFDFILHKDFHKPKQMIKSLLVQYKGPIDVGIDFLHKNFPNISSMTLATNIEEPCYMYYLNVKVIMGLMKPNFIEDIKLSPDIIIYRKHHNYYFGNENELTHMEIFNKYLKNGTYKSLSFPIVDLQFNNFPSLLGDPVHAFSSNYSNDNAQKFNIIIKKELFDRMINHDK